MNISFEAVANPPKYPYRFCSLRKVKVEEWLTDDLIKHELKGYNLTWFQTSEEKDSKITAYLLTNGYVLVKKKYSYLIFQSIEDLKNAIKTREYWEEQNKLKTTPDVSFKKSIITESPKEQILLDEAGCEHIYYQYDVEAIKPFLDSFPIKKRTERSKSSVILTGKDGRIVDHRSYISYVFANADDHQFWYNHPAGSDSTAKAWCGRNPYHKNVLEYKEDLLQKLAEITQLERMQIQYGPGTHHTVHKSLEQFVYDDRFVNQIFLPLTIYLGELQINRYGGHWKLLEKASVKTWVPVIHINDHDYDIGRYILWDLLDTESENFPSIATVLWSGKGRIRN